MTRALACGAVRIGLETDDAGAAEWLTEFLTPWFVPSDAFDIAVSLSISAEAYAAFAARQPADAAPRACFRLDREVVSLRAWPETGGVAVADAERSCFLHVEPSRIAIVADPASRRWRFTLQWIFHEIAATALRRAAIDLHAAAIEIDRRAIAFLGPKRAGKTTLTLHCLRSAPCRWIANDRAFATRAGASFTIRGMPNVVKIQPQTLVDFPELGGGAATLSRPYLHSLTETAAEPRIDAVRETEFALSPPQLARALGIEAVAEAPLGGLVFPEVDPGVEGMIIEPLSRAEAAARIWANLYAKNAAGEGSTLFDEIGGGESAPDRRGVEALAAAAPSRRVVLGRGAYTSPDFAARLLGELRR